MPSTPRAATGAQFVLTSGATRAVVGQLAAVLREFSFAGQHFCETWAEHDPTPLGCGIVLAPWPNRVEDGQWTAPDGSLQQLDITEVGRNNASHGLLRNTAYQLLEVKPTKLTLAAPVLPQHGYPFNLDTSVTYELVPSSKPPVPTATTPSAEPPQVSETERPATLRVTHAVRNLGSSPAPFGIGAHPYLRVADVPTQDCTLTITAATVAVPDDRLLPREWLPVGQHGPDLRTGQQIAGQVWDVAYTDLALVDGRFEHRLDAPDGRGVTLWADPAFGWVQVFTPTSFPNVTGGGTHQAVAIEPQTCGSNALANGRDLIWLEPGADWSASWGIEPRP
jgi:aldose 1-epimerase